MEDYLWSAAAASTKWKPSSKTTSLKNYKAHEKTSSCHAAGGWAKKNEDSYLLLCQKFKLFGGKYICHNR